MEQNILLERLFIMVDIGSLAIMRLQVRKNEICIDGSSVVHSSDLYKRPTLS
jgi:hypothetical protein